MSKQKVVSYSQYSTYMSCGRKYYYSYIKKAMPFSKNIYTTFGTAMHEVLQEYLELAYDKGDRDSFNFFEKLKERLSYHNDNDKTLTNIEYINYLIQGVETLLQFHFDFKKIMPKVKDWELVANEFEIKEDLNDLNFTQYIDSLFKKRDSDEFLIVDIKTSQFRYVQKYIDLKKKMQLHLYRESIRRLYNVDDSKIRTQYLVLAVNRDVAYGKINKYQVIDIESTQTKDFYKFVDIVFKDGQRREDIDLYPKNHTKLCDYCAIKSECDNNYLIN